MRAEDLADALEGKRDGKGWKCRCPVHGGRSLKVQDTDRANPLVYCFGGCSFREVVGALKDMGLWEDDRPRNPRVIKDRKREAEIRRAKRDLEAFNKAHANPSTVLLDSDWRRRDRAKATLARLGVIGKVSDG